MKLTKSERAWVSRPADTQAHYNNPEDYPKEIRHYVLNRGWTQTMIADKLNMSAPVICEYCQRHNIVRPFHDNGKRKYKLTEVNHYLSLGMGEREIAKVLGKRVSTISRSIDTIRSLSADQWRVMLNFELDTSDSF